MTNLKTGLPALALTLLLSTTVQAQSVPSSTAPVGLTRAQVSMERDAYLGTHRWDETAGGWVLKSGTETPWQGMARRQVDAERDAFFSQHRWDESRGGWLPDVSAPAYRGMVTRTQARRDTAEFLAEHRWDEAAQQWTAYPATSTWH
jgi:hypothetical protein